MLVDDFVAVDGDDARDVVGPLSADVGLATVDKGVAVADEVVG